MTFEQFDKANELHRQISRLEKLLADVKSVSTVGSPFKDTGFYIKKSFNQEYIHNIENFELGILIDAIQSNINALEHEFDRL